MFDSVLVWFRRDLRDYDHAALSAALRRARSVFCAVVFDRDILDAVPQELQDLRCQYGFDFGKFDYVEVEGRAVLIDINKTPTTVARQDSPRLRELAEGIRDFPGMGN